MQSGSATRNTTNEASKSRRISVPAITVMSTLLTSIGVPQLVTPAPILVFQLIRNFKNFRTNTFQQPLE